MFTQECFIRKNTEQLIFNLYKLGYEYYRPLDRFKNICTNFGKNIDFDGNESDRYVIDAFDDGYISQFNKIMIDCGTNEELFLAIASLRDDSDKHQLFTNGKEWIQCEKEDWIDEISYLCVGGNYNYDKNGELSVDFHKATVEELIKHFTV